MGRYYSADPTMSYYYAVTECKWIIAFQWIEKSITEQRIVDPVRRYFLIDFYVILILSFLDPI
jgi:hypothetical protein